LTLLDDVKVVFDGANGAGYKVGPRTLTELGAEVIPIACSPNGRNINDGCGSTHPELLQLTVPAVRADAGIALDGDGDRVVMVDELGQTVDGDQLLYILATARQREGALKGPVVGTVMSNLGLERALGKHDIEFRRARVGDRYVLETLCETGGIIGGETSGHVICLDRTTTGDGLIAALQVLAVMKRTGTTLSKLAGGMAKYPQTMLNVRTEKSLDPSKSSKIQEAISQVEGELAESGRVVLRASGTEPVIRVMVEGENENQVLHLAERLAAVVADAAS
jgi:phosphoglucosamine mutase